MPSPRKISPSPRRSFSTSFLNERSAIGADYGGHCLLLPHTTPSAAPTPRLLRGGDERGGDRRIARHCEFANGLFVLCTVKHCEFANALLVQYMVRHCKFANGLLVRCMVK